MKQSILAGFAGFVLLTATGCKTFNWKEVVQYSDYRPDGVAVIVQSGMPGTYLDIYMDGPRLMATGLTTDDPPFRVIKNNPWLHQSVTFTIILKVYDLKSKALLGIAEWRRDINFGDRWDETWIVTGGDLNHGGGRRRNLNY